MNIKYPNIKSNFPCFFHPPLCVCTATQDLSVMISNVLKCLPAEETLPGWHGWVQWSHLSGVGRASGEGENPTSARHLKVEQNACALCRHATRTHKSCERGT